MDISFWRLLLAAPGIKSALKPIGTTQDWYQSQTIWWNILKALGVLLAALGLYGVLPEKDLQAISASLAILVPTVLTLMDALVNVWLRLRTSKAITGTKEAVKVEATLVVAEAKMQEVVQDATDNTQKQTLQATDQLPQ